MTVVFNGVEFTVTKVEVTWVYADDETALWTEYRLTAEKK